ncbi:MAG TPA: mechanosensitive ion channel family protein [Gemmatimonadaceae bacterium]|jgi:small-conductance mechanosensitive channel
MFAFVTLVSFATIAAAQQDSARATVPRRNAADSSRQGAPVVFATDTLFHLYGGLGPFSAETRAAAIAARLGQIAAGVARGDSIRVTDRETYSELSVGDVVVMTVLDDDARPLGIPRGELARRYATRLRSAVSGAAARTSARALLEDAGYAIAATIALLVLLQLLSMGFSRLYVRIEALRRVRLPLLHIQDFELLSAGRLSSLLIGVARTLRVVLTLLLLYVYIPLVLSFFPWTAPFSQRIIGYAIRPFAVAWFAFVDFLPNLFYLAAGVVITRYVLAFVHLIFGAIGNGSIQLGGFYADWAEPTYKILRVLILAFAAIVLYPYLPGASSDAFKGVSIFLGVLFSLGSSGAVGNMVAGIVLTYTRAFQLGDRVQIGGTVGDVTEKTLLVTRLRTIKNEAVTIPNGAVLSSQVVNFTTLSDQGLILHTSVTIGYDAPWRRVHELLIEGARRTEHVLAEPAPFVLQTGLDDFYVSYELNAYTSRPELMAVIYSYLHQNIQEAFNEGGVEIMSPHYTALRDGNETTIPAGQLASRYRAPAFRVQHVDGATHNETEERTKASYTPPDVPRSPR